MVPACNEQIQTTCTRMLQGRISGNMLSSIVHGETMYADMTEISGEFPSRAYVDLY
jgi:hypothetical protein